jgi:hypothetical protein
MTDQTVLPTSHAKVEALRVDLHALIDGAHYPAVASVRRGRTSQSLHDAVDDALDRLRYHLG